MPFDFTSLTPALILDALLTTELVLDSGLTELNSYENRVFAFQCEDKRRYVVKFYRPERWSAAQIQAEHDFLLALNAAEVAVAAPLCFTPTGQVSAQGASVLHHGGYLFAIWPSVGGRAFEVDNLDQLEAAGRLLGRLHQVGAAHALSLRPSLTTARFLHEPRALLAEGDWLPSALKAPFFATLDELIAQVDTALNRPYQTIALHGDCHAGNILWRDGPLLVDFDDCLRGPAIQDLWMLQSGSVAEQRLQLDALLCGYEEFMDFDPSELALIEPLRAMRMVHYMGWLARRWQDPAFTRHFPWFNHGDYWAQQLSNLKEQCLALKAPPLTLTPAW
ncbi:MAG: serine/threonine protein kinase [Aeromonas sp.]